MIPQDNKPRTIDAYVRGKLVFRRTENSETQYYIQKHGEIPREISKSEYEEYIEEASDEHQEKQDSAQDKIMSLLNFHN